MADCSYSRCIQQRRNIRRELQKWTKNMVYIVGLERIAEELMGRRKWKLYQDSMQRNYLQPLNNNIKNEKYQLDTKNEEQDQQHKTQPQEQVVNDIKLNSITRDDIKVEIVKEEQDDDRIKEEADESTIVDSLSQAVEVKLEEQEEETGGIAQEVAEDEDRLKDWSPQSKCYFCVDGKLAEHNNHGDLSPRQTDSDSSDSPSDVEAPPSLTPSPNVNNHHHRNNMTALDASMAALAAVAALSGNAPGPQAQMPFYPPMPPNWFHLTNIARNFHPERMETEKPGEQPLDLSSKGGGNLCIGESKINANIRLPTLDSKHIYKAKPRMSAVAGRRTYTEDELQAALRDIQSGKLGTRRAAVIYGIPRSTLRNKVYKLALERERESHLNSVALTAEEEAMDEEKELSGTEEEKEVEKALERPLLSISDLLRNMQNPEALKALLQKSNDGNDLYAGVEHSAIGPYIQNLLGGLIQGQKHSEEGGVPEVVKRMMAEEHMLNQQLKIHNNGNSDNLNRPSPSNSVIMKNDKCKSESDMETEDSTSNVILKIPSFKPTSSKNGDNTYRNSIDSGSLVSPPVTSESGSPPILPGKGMSLKDVKDVIAKSISQKFQQSPEPMRHSMIDEYKRGGFTPPLGGISVIKTQDLSRSYPPPQQKQPQLQQQQQQQQQNSSNNSSGGKGTRPKRGKYRNYDRDSLVEAVRAVQRGEMSVHRAGSYYGVPHSTLEYKVKERHLMRPRKRDPKPNPVDEKLASLKQNDIRIAAAAVTAEKLKTHQQQAIKPTQKFPPTSPNGIKLPIYDPNIAPMGYNAPFPFWPHPSLHHFPPIDYGRSSTSAFPPTAHEQFYASQMMQKLQEDSRTNPNNTPNAAGGAALPKSARQMAESLLDGTGSNAFLDGIIRSTLESGVPSHDDKKADKNVAPENMSNKALLDQLCRNSRFTKPSITESSSGDDEASTKKESPLNFADHKEDNSDQDGSIIDNSETIELSNDSNDSSKFEGDDDKEKPLAAVVSPQMGRIYIKQDLTNPEHLKPENLVRYRDALHDVDVDRNGITEGSASESDAAQD